MNEKRSKPDNPPKKNGCFISFCLFAALTTAVAAATLWLLQSGPMT